LVFACTTCVTCQNCNPLFSYHSFDKGARSCLIDAPLVGSDTASLMALLRERGRHRCSAGGVVSEEDHAPAALKAMCSASVPHEPAVA
jgi:hypothetical protein